MQTKCFICSFVGADGNLGPTFTGGGGGSKCSQEELFWGQYTIQVEPQTATGIHYMA